MRYPGERGSSAKSLLHDLSWGAVAHAAHAPQLGSCNYCVCAHACVCVCMLCFGMFYVGDRCIHTEQSICSIETTQVRFVSIQHYRNHSSLEYCLVYNDFSVGMYMS